MINVELKGGAVKEFENGTTPAEIAKSIGAGSVSYTHLTLPTTSRV